MSIVRRVATAAFLFALVVGFSAIPAGGFTIDGVLDNGTRDDPSDDLEDAARWTNRPGSFVEDDVRGLGGGLEYAIARDFFDRILPSFVDQARPTKAQLIEAIRRAFDRWAAGSPLRFIDVSDQVFALQDLGFPGSGAEIDLLAVPGGDRAFRRTTLAANTSVTFSNERPIGTTGREFSGKTITSADILFNVDASYYFDPNDPEVQRLQQRGATLMHFESLLLHEISHAIGLDHPDEFPERNFDTDLDPTNPMIIDCQYPLQGLKLSPNIDRTAVATSRGSGSHRLELTYDDLGGREFLYPSCDSRPPTSGPPSPPRPGGGTLKSFDVNNNDLIDDAEFFAIIDAWINGQLDDVLFFDAIDLWVSQRPISSAEIGGLKVQADGRALVITSQSMGAASIAIQIFDLAGRTVFAGETAGTKLYWNYLDQDLILLVLLVGRQT